jgi:hypothetical protein
MQAHKPKSQLNGPFASQLRLELTEQGVIKVNVGRQMGLVPLLQHTATFLTRHDP